MRKRGKILIKKRKRKIRKIKKRRGKKRKSKIDRMAKTQEKNTLTVGPAVRSPVSAFWALRTKNLGPAELLHKVCSEFHHNCAL